LPARDARLASYVRPFSRDYGKIARLLVEGFDIGRGLILDPCHVNGERGRELRDEARKVRLELILDPRTVELSTPGSLNEKQVAQLPWAGKELPELARFQSSDFSQEFCKAIADFAVAIGASAILAPSHYLPSLPHPWLDVDVSLSLELRTALDRSGGEHIAIYYPLIAKLSVLAQPTIREHLLARLSEIIEARAVDALWLRVHNFGTTNSGSVNLRRYIHFAREAHRLRVPIVAERTGTVGLALLALGAVGGIESGVTFGESYNVTQLKRRRGTGAVFVPLPRVYLPQIGAFLSKDKAETFLTRPGYRNRYGCQENCCRRGVQDMLSDPRRHFLVCRTRDVDRLSITPAAERLDHYMESWLRPASDRATHAMKAEPSLLNHRERLDQWRMTLSAVREEDQQQVPTISTVPYGGRIGRTHP
jgi:hypothetical protein